MPGPSSPPLLLLPLDPDAATPLYRQVYDGLRSTILAGRLAAGARLPSSRALATELGVARNTVVLAFDLLRAEGYLAGHKGGGTRVRAQVPDRLLTATPARAPAARRAVAAVVPSRWTRIVAEAGEWGATHRVRATAFALGVPAIDAFPVALWTRLTTRRWRRHGVFLGQPAAPGERALRAAIADYVTTARGARCSADHVIVVGGAQQALDLIARVLVEPGDRVWIENPGYTGARAVLIAAGADVCPVPVNDEGLDVSAGIRAAPRARLVYVTPSHQFPLGAVMSASRRLALLTWARRAGAWIVEDDYDGEFRYAGRPLPCLQGLDATQTEPARVLYVGTFSKTLAPALRLGYVIVPEQLVETFRVAGAITSGAVATMDQGVLTDFITEGHYARHVRRVRALCAERQEVLLDASRRRLAGALDLVPDVAGLHLVGWLQGISEGAAAEAARAGGVQVSRLSAFTMGRTARGALLLGYAASDSRAIRTGVERLSRALGDR